MNYNKIRKMDISNGPGVRVSIFMQGCSFNCKNCFNPETHDFDKGKKFSEETITTILNLAKPNYIDGLSILGGEPLHPKNIEGTKKLAHKFKDEYPNKSIWLWSGYLYEDIKDKDIFKYIDVLIDGNYKDELHSFLLKYCGSSNQRVIDIKETIKKNRIILKEDNNKAKERLKKTCV